MVKKGKGKRKSVRDSSSEQSSSEEETISSKALMARLNSDSKRLKRVEEGFEHVLDFMKVLTKRLDSQPMIQTDIETGTDGKGNIEIPAGLSKNVMSLEVARMLKKMIRRETYRFNKYPTEDQLIALLTERLKYSPSGTPISKVWWCFFCFIHY